MLAARTARVDELVRAQWASMPAGIAIAAVGGYGRCELFPFSDIDLLILTPDEKIAGRHQRALALFLRDLWDLGLRISQSVHTPEECNLIDASNAELAVSLLDRRFLAGDEALFARSATPAPNSAATSPHLTRERHGPFQNTIYHLEPNVKDAPGGLRDLAGPALAPNLAPAIERPSPASRALRDPLLPPLPGGRDDNKLISSARTKSRSSAAPPLPKS